MRVLGISAFYHDSAAALIEDGRIAAAAQEERFSARSMMRHFHAMPSNIVWRTQASAWTVSISSSFTRSRS